MNEDGTWRTVSGRRIYIKKGQSLTDAMKESKKFDNKKEDYIQFKNKQEAHEYVKKMAIKITDEQEESLGEYKQSSNQLNEQLRNNEKGSKYWMTSDLDKMINKSELKDNVLLCRGLDEKGAKSLGINLKDLESNVGKTLTDKGYLSTTTDQLVAKSFGENGTVLLIKTPKGTKGLSMSSGGFANTESEILLSRNSNLKVTKVTKEGYLIADYAGSSGKRG